MAMRLCNSVGKIIIKKVLFVVPVETITVHFSLILLCFIYALEKSNFKQQDSAAPSCFPYMTKNGLGNSPQRERPTEKVSNGPAVNSHPSEFVQSWQFSSKPVLTTGNSKNARELCLI